MKTLTKHDYVKNFLESGKVLTNHIAKVNWNCERLSAIIYRLRKRHSDRWIIDLGTPGKHSKYWMIQRGHKFMINGWRFTFQNISYVKVSGSIQEADILLTAENGIRKVQIMVTQSDFIKKDGTYKGIMNKLNKELK